MKPFLLFAGLLLAAGPAAAQAPRISAPALLSAATITQAPAAPDTLAAIRRLFAAKRKRQGYVVGGTVVAAVGTVGIAAANRPADTGSSGFGVIGSNNLDLAMVGVVAVPVVLAEALFLGGWGHKYERQVLAIWQQQHQLPRAVKRRLKTIYFQ